jgi:hypothetical protein
MVARKRDGEMMRSFLTRFLLLASLALLCSASKDQGRVSPDKLQPLPSPNGAYFLTVPVEMDGEGVPVWIVTISDSAGEVLFRSLGPDHSEVMPFLAWDEENRAWVCFSDLRLNCYGLDSGLWETVYSGEPGVCREGVEPPAELFPRFWKSVGEPSSVLPETLLVDSGPGWRFSLSCPEIPAGLAFIRDLVVGNMTEMKREFASNAEADFADWGEEVDFMTWTIEATMSLPPAPDGMLTAACSWWEYSGGAHGNTGNRLYRFQSEPNSGGPVPWVGIGTRDILADSTELVALSALVVDSLVKVLDGDADMDWIMEGAGPEWSNYELLTPVPDSSGALAGFSIQFPEYSVAPYVSGPLEVCIPIGLLRP